MSDRIEQQVELNASVSRVWRAIGDHRQFGAWFRVAIDAPFAVGEVSRGHLREPGYEHLVWQATVQAIGFASGILLVRRFAFSWHPYAIDPAVDYTGESPTLVEFLLEPTATGTLLRVTESGFDAVPDHRRAEAFRMNEGGWAEQMNRIRIHLDGA